MKQQQDRLKEIVEHSWFQFVSIRTQSGLFSLKPNQRAELVKWAQDEKHDKDWWKPTKLAFINNDGNEMPVELHEAAWQSDEQIQAKKWKEVCSTRQFGHVKIRVGDETFSLRSHQEKELVKWAGGKKFDKEWLRVGTSGIPQHFEAQDGSEGALLLDVDAWLQGTLSQAEADEGDAPPAKKAKKSSASKKAVAKETMLVPSLPVYYTVVLRPMLRVCRCICRVRA